MARPRDLADSGIVINTLDSVTSNIQTQLDDKQAYDLNLTGFVNAFNLPITDGSNGQVLSTNGSGTLSFTNVAGSDPNALTSSDIGVTVQPYNANTLTSSDIGVTVQSYVTGILTQSDIGGLVQDYDLNLTNFLTEFTLPITDGSNGQVLSTNGSGTLSFTNVAGASSYGDSDVGTYLSTNGYDTSTNIIASITDSAPATLDTLNELAAALGDDPNFATTVSNSLGLKANSADLATVATSGSYTDLTGTPTLAAVATSGSYTDLTGTPTLATVATSGSYTDLTGTPTLATVATSGSYNDLSDQPIIPADVSDLTDTTSLIGGGGGGGGSFEAVASGSISDGAPVILSADGTVTAVTVQTSNQLLHTLNNPNAYGSSLSDKFGTSVAVSGNYAIVSSPYEDQVEDTNTGKAYIFDVTSGALLHTIDHPNFESFALGSDAFSHSVGISGNYAIIGVPGKDASSEVYSVGVAYIFNVTTGALVHTLDNPNAYSTPDLDYFGESVAISGNYAIVGANGEDDAGGSSSGKAYIFNVTTGALVHTLDNPNAYSTSVSDFFGTSVAISGNYAIVGAYEEDDAGGTTSGKAYIFNVTTGALVYTLDNPTAYGTSAYDRFGLSIAMSDNYAIVGAYGEADAGGTRSGKAYIYNVTTGALLHTLDNPNPYGTSAEDGFGFSVAISDNYAVVGASGPYSVYNTAEDDAGGNNSGKVYIFDVITGALVHTYDNPNAYGTSTNDFFGFSTAISGNNLIVGANQEDDAGGTNSGKVYIFDLTLPATNLTAENYAGIADGAYSDAATATIQTAGSVDDAQSGLTPGQAYYVQADGTLGLTTGNPGLTTGNPIVFAGTAVSATKLLIGKAAPVVDLATVDLAAVATSGSYNDLTDTPTGEAGLTTGKAIAMAMIFGG